MACRVVIAGGGIVGLATAYQLIRRGGYQVTVLEKEAEPALHQTGRNSGVIHSGVYYPPGSTKALNCRAGRAELLEFCQEHDLPYSLCGKVIVATEPAELPLLTELHRRGRANGVNCELIGQAALARIEPHAWGLRALWVEDAGIIDYRVVCAVLLRSGADFQGHTKVLSVSRVGSEVVVRSTRGEFACDYFVNCAGLHSDRVCRSTGQEPGLRIVPFKGEYFRLRESAQRLCRTLIYPVPDPAFPFLGVHLTSTIDGGVEVGPNAVLALGREAYQKGEVNTGDLLETLTYPGFMKLAVRHWRMGLGEMWRSYSKAAFTKALQRLCPDIQETDLIPAPCGIRAQALHRSGSLEGDFRIVRDGPVVNVLNAPSPAATSALAIGRQISELILS